MSYIGIRSRADRNLNPVAMTTEVAQQAGLLHGQDFIRGDSFQDANGKVFYTAKFLSANPVLTTLEAINVLTFYTQSGRPRWDYVGIPPETWRNLSTAAKLGVIHWMYKREGGSELDHFFWDAISPARMETQAPATTPRLRPAEHGGSQNHSERTRPLPGSTVGMGAPDSQKPEEPS